MNPLEGIRSLLIDTPLLLTQDKAEQILGVLGVDRLAGILTNEVVQAAVESASTPPAADTSSTTKDVAVIDISGTLVNKTRMVMSESGLRSYKSINADIELAAADETIGTIILRIDSPGGQVVGIKGVAETIRQAKAEKPVIAVVEGMAASAAYWIASQASQIVAEDHSLIGSIGAIAMHLDVSEHLKKEGVKVTVIKSAVNKDEFSKFKPLGDEMKAKFQAEIDAIGKDFTATVVAARSSAQAFSEKEVVALKAGSVDAATALRIGLIDAIGDFDSVLASLLAEAQAESEGVSATASAQAAATPVTTQEEIMQINQTVATDGTAAAATQASAVDPKVERTGKIAQACQAHGVLGILAALDASTIPVPEATAIAQGFAIAAAGKSDEQIEGIKAFITPGQTASGFSRDVTAMLAKADEATATSTAIVGNEGLKAQAKWDTFAAVQAQNGNFKPDAETQAVIESLRARAAAA